MTGAPPVLARADRAAALPRLGGMARPGGVVIASQRFWALARTDGTIVEGEMPGLPGFVSRVPILRGLARLGSAFAPLATGSGVARRGERGLLGVALVVPAAAAFLSDRLQIMVGLVLVAALLGWLFRGKTLSLHGAEHRAIGACEARALVDTWEARAKPSRFSRRCGTNFAALSLATALLLYAAVPAARDAAWSFPLGIAALGLTMELWFLIQAAPPRAASILLAPGLALQRLTTREPSPEQTRLALCAVASVLRRELGP
jgi:uncharacterized protein YqhQ